LADVPAGTAFKLTLLMRSIATTATVSPTVSIQTYYGNGAMVDRALNVPFSSTPLTNTNMTIVHTFTVPTEFKSVRGITAGYYGHFLMSFQPAMSSSVVNGSRIVLTLPSGFTPSGNTLGLPLSCRINGVRHACTYVLSPSFIVTIAATNNNFNTGTNVLNITTDFQNSDGVQYPTTQGRHLIKLEIVNATSGAI